MRLNPRFLLLSGRKRCATSSQGCMRTNQFSAELHASNGPVTLRSGQGGCKSRRQVCLEMFTVGHPTCSYVCAIWSYSYGFER